MFFKSHDSILFDDSWFYNKNILKISGNVDWNDFFKKYEYELGAPMGEPSAFGVVYPFEPKKKSKTRILPLYVLKRVEISNKNPHLLAKTIQEAIFGESFIDAPIPIVIAHRYNDKLKSYEILMQNVILSTMHQPMYDSSSLIAYLWRQPKRELSADDMQLVHDTLVRFYKKTKHFHGDLHLNNMMVTFSKDAPNKLASVYIIDFGSAAPFLRADWDKIDKMTRVHQFIPVMNRAYSKLDDRENYLNTNYLKNIINEKVVWLKHGGAVVHNLQQKQSPWFWEQLMKFSRKKQTVKRIKTVTS